MQWTPKEDNISLSTSFENSESLRHVEQVKLVMKPAHSLGLFE